MQTLYQFFIHQEILQTFAMAMSLLRAAVDSGDTSMCRTLLGCEETDVEERQPDTQFTPVHKAAIHGHEQIIQLLISHKADINSRDMTEHTPLHAASQKGHLACVLTLLKAGADPLLAADDGILPIHMAAGRKHPEVVKILIEKGGCSPDQVRETHCTAITCTALQFFPYQHDYHNHPTRPHC